MAQGTEYVHIAAQNPSVEFWIYLKLYLGQFYV